MKFYIPTSNLNLDNILQSECILPISHYSHRCSGYNTFEQIDELRPFEAIVLFKYPVQFQINDSGRYNFPILIEIEDDIQTSDFADNEIQDGVYLCNHRLNLTPKNCRIYFFTESAYNLTIINTQSSKAIKYFKDYLIYPNAFMLKPVNMPKLKESTINIKEFDDNTIDKQKGLLFAYLLGNKMSVNRNIAKQLRITQELYNILTNLISSPSSITSFSANLTSLLTEYKSVDSVEAENLKKFHKNFDELLGKRFIFLKGYLIDFLKKIDCWNLVYDTLCRKWNCSFLPDTSMLNAGSDFISLRNEIERRTHLTMSEYSRCISIDNLNCVHVSGNSISFTEARLVNVVVKYIINNTITPEILLAKRMDFYMNVMTEIVSILKAEISEQKWQESKEKAYVNSLYAFINDPACSFNLNSIENIELKSIAAFILRGHSYKDCITYLRINEIEDYRFVLSLWGCLCGYMEMSKDALANVLTMSNYELIYKKIFGTGLAEITKQEGVIPTQINETSSVDLNLYKQILDVFKYKESEKIICSLKEQNATEDSVENCLNEVLKKSPYKKAPKQCTNACHALKIYLNRRSKTMITEKLETSGLTKVGKQQILSLLGFEEPKVSKKRKKNSEQTSLFLDIDAENDNIHTKSNASDSPMRTIIKEKNKFDFKQERNLIFKYDLLAWDKIADLIPTEGWTNSKGKTRQELIKEDLKWYQGSDMSIGDNKKDIVRFCDKFKTQPDKNGKQQGQYYTLELRKAIKERLLSLYCNND